MTGKCRSPSWDDTVYKGEEYIKNVPKVFKLNIFLFTVIIDYILIWLPYYNILFILFS